jgi:1,4-alpha-glucan branching enzyme
MSIKKQILKSKPVCKVSFKLSNELAQGAKAAFLVGDFNNWNETSHEMKPLKDGSFSFSLDLETGHNYQFRYLLDGTTWINDDEADSYQPSGIGQEQNGIILL